MMHNLDVKLHSVLNSKLIQTNDIIPESERLHVGRLLHDIDRELESLDTEIHRTQAHLLSLQNKRASYVADRKRLYPAIAPHKHLPSEILAEIFAHYAADIADEVIYESAPRDRCLAMLPWALGQVCSRWRQIALGEARFWGTIGFNRNKQEDLPMLEEAFRRGGQSKLWLCAGEDETMEHVYNNFLRDVVCSQSRRITDLSLFILRETFQGFFGLPPNSFEALERILIVIVDEGTHWNLIPHDVSVFRGATRLRKIEIATSFYVPSSFPMNMGLHFPQLTAIVFPEISIRLANAHELMTLCTNLRECSLRLQDNFRFLPPSHLKAYRASSIRVSYLHSLKLDQEDETDPKLYNDFLRPLALPVLQKFEFTLLGESEEIGPPHTGLLELAKIVNGLSRLPLRSELTYVGGSNISEVVRALPFLTSLTANQCVFSSSTIQLMAQKHCLSRLTSLSCNVALPNMDAFIEMLTARWVRGKEAQRAGSGAIFSAGIERARIDVTDTSMSDPHAIRRLSQRIRDVQKRLGVLDADIDFRDTAAVSAQLFASFYGRGRDIDAT